MKKNFLIMLLTVFCVSFAFAQQDDMTVRGFVPAGGTTNEVYGVLGQTFGVIQGSENYEWAEGLAQAQLVGDTIEVVIGCDDTYDDGRFQLTSEDVQALLANHPNGKFDTFYTYQVPNVAIYNYDSLYVMHLFVCPCTVNDCEDNEYVVYAFDKLCWTKTSMKTHAVCYGPKCASVDFALQPMTYETETTKDLNDSIFGLLYTWENAIAGDSHCDSDFVQGICPCGWHLPNADEIDTILNSMTNDLRSANGNWVVPEGITNASKFTAEPIGYYNAASARFEGHHSEVDFWYRESGCTANYFQILYYCDKPKQEPRNAAADAMSVRCVLDMIYDYEKSLENAEQGTSGAPTAVEETQTQPGTTQTQEP